MNNYYLFETRLRVTRAADPGLAPNHLFGEYTGLTGLSLYAYTYNIYIIYIILVERTCVFTMV